MLCLKTCRYDSIFSGKREVILSNYRTKCTDYKKNSHSTEVNMAKKLQLLLNKNVEKLGKRGDLVDVAPGYARNYLVPQGLGVLVTPGILRQVDQRREKERLRLLAILEEAKSRKVALQTINNFVIRKQVGEQDAIFGTVTTQEVVDIIKQNAGLEIERQAITLPEIKKTGKYQTDIKLHAEVTAQITIEVAPL